MTAEAPALTTRADRDRAEALRRAHERFPVPPDDASDAVQSVWKMQVETYAQLQLDSWAAPDRRVSTAVRSVVADEAGDDTPGVLLSDVQREEIEWLWRNRIARGKVTILEGDPDEGKSALTLDLASRVSTGALMPFDATERPAGGVVILSAEDGLGDTIRPRLEAAGADLTRIRGFRFEELPSIPTGLDAIERAIIDTAAILVVVDPLMAFLVDKVDSHRDHDIRRALTPLAALAARTGVAILTVRHLNKGLSANAKHRGGGSIGIGALSRSVMLAAPDPRDGGRKILARVKNNLGPSWRSLAYRLEAAGDSVRVVWVEETDYVSSDLLRSDTAPAKRATAEQLLRNELESGPAPAAVVKAKLERQGVAPRTLDRAKASLGVEASPAGFGGEWIWKLPESATSCTERQAQNVAHSGNDGAL